MLNFQNGQNELVSVVIPTYNSERFIRITILSVLQQTYKNWELIIIDDCSSDNTIKIVEELASQDNRVIYHKNIKNLGAGDSRNIGLELAQGRFITFLDSDDLWHKEKLEIQVLFMIEKIVPISFTSYNLIDEFGSLLNKTIRSVPILDYNGVLKNTIIGMSTSMIDTKVVGRDFRFINLRTRQDLYLWITLLKRGHKAYGLPNILASYRIRTNSISSNKFKAAKSTWKIYYKIEKLGLIKSLYYFSFYAFNALRKRMLS